MDIYSGRLMELSNDVPRQGRLPAPGGTATAHSRVCGATVTVDLVLDGGVVVDYAHEVRACAFGMAASSVIARNVVGTSEAELRELGLAMRRMLKEGGEPPAGKWADLAVLQPVSQLKARHTSTLLVFDAVARALDAAQATPAS